jgi:hypothetical protein
LLLPTNVSTGRVTGQFLAGVVDGGDGDQEPDAIPLGGTVKFTASVGYLPDPTASPNAATILPLPIVAVLDTDGYLCTPMPDGVTPAYRGVRLVATDDPDLSVDGWTWSAEYRFNAISGVTPSIPTHSFAVPSGSVIDLASVVRVPSSPGLGTEQAEALVAAAQDAASRSADSASSAASYAASAANQAAANDSGVSSLVSTNGTNTNTQVKALAAAAAAPKLDAAQKAAANGVASLDAAAKVPVPQIPAGLPTDQYDYVQALAARSKCTKLQLKKNTGTNEVEVSCLTPSGAHVTYQFYGSTAGDDYRVLANIWAGTSTPITVQAAKVIGTDMTLAGTYASVAGGAFNYTTDKATPATFTATITVDNAGSALRFHTYRNNQGGVWQLTISGGELDQQVTVSTYTSAAGAYDTTGVTLMSNVRAGTYTITGKFLGDDPANTPSGGAGTGRGWLGNNADTSSASATVFSVYAPFRQVNKDILLKPASNMDIAMQVQPAGATNLEWMPYHSVATMFQADAPVYLDGDTVIDVSSMATNQYRALTSFELVQRVYGRNSASGSTNLVELATSHILRTTGQVTVNGKWKALANIELGDNYHMMLPASMALFDKLVTSIGNGYATSAALAGTVTNLVPENDTAMSHMFLSSTNKTVAGAVRYTNPQETIRRGKGNKNPDATKAFLQHRDASITKVYNRAYAAGTAIPSGTVQRFSGDYIFTQGPGLYDQFAI